MKEDPNKPDMVRELMPNWNMVNDFVLGEFRRDLPHINTAAEIAKFGAAFEYARLRKVDHDACTMSAWFSATAGLRPR